MQGFNMGRYMPPASLDQSLAAQRTPGFNETSRTKRGPGGAQTVRFEMPFAIWCTTCRPEAIIGQGIRFNAEKKKVGGYYSTPVWGFRMKHGACGGTIEIRTDPEKREYTVYEGGRRRETGLAVAKEGIFGEILTEEERERRKTDAFAQLEGKRQEAAVSKSENERVGQLLEDRQRYWDDPYTLNQKLRRDFRVGRKIRAANEKQKSEVVERLGLGIELLDPTQEDADRAALVEFGDHSDVTAFDRMALTRPLFHAASDGDPRTRSSDNSKGQPSSAQSHRTALQLTIVDNTRAGLDPFVQQRANAATGNLPKLVGVKRKREITPAVNGSGGLTSSAGGDKCHAPGSNSSSGPISSLVSYSSDTD